MARIIISFDKFVGTLIFVNFPQNYVAKEVYQNILCFICHLFGVADVAIPSF
jgi:hypothetical protein